jgi:hypothetical protein
MKANRRTAVLTMLLFVLMLVAGSYPALAGETVPEEETARLVKEAD